MVAVLTFGAIKYEPENWRFVEDAFERYVGALRRHISEKRRGHVFDKETGLLVLAHVACCSHFLLALEIAQGGHEATLPERLKGAIEAARKLRAARLARG